MKIIELQGSDIVGAPQQPGIYAWYYRPRAFGNREAETLGKLITIPSSVKTEISLRYRLTWNVDSNANTLYGKDRQPVNKAVLELVADGGDLTKFFIQKFMVPHFAKPLYIGISDNLSTRVKEHYDSLTELWDLDAPVSKYLTGHPNASVEDVLDQLGLDHSFAISARVKGIAPRDLVVCVCPIQDPDKLRDLEQILQILADPICGRS